MKNLGVLLIDMQDKFRWCIDDEELVENQRRLLEYANKQDLPIFVLEYEACGKTIDELQPFLNKKAKIIPKYNDNGFIIAESNDSAETYYRDGSYDTFDLRSSQSKLVRESGLRDKLDVENIKNLIVTGINRGACYYETIKGAVKRDYHVYSSPDLTNEKFDGALGLDARGFNNYFSLDELLQDIEREE